MINVISILNNAKSKKFGRIKFTNIINATLDNIHISIKNNTTLEINTDVENTYLVIFELEEATEKEFKTAYKEFIKNMKNGIPTN